MTAWRVIRRHIVILVAIAAQRDVAITFTVRLPNTLGFGRIEIVLAAPATVFAMAMLLTVPAMLRLRSTPAVVVIVVILMSHRCCGRARDDDGS